MVDSDDAPNFQSLFKYYDDTDKSDQERLSRFVYDVGILLDHLVQSGTDVHGDQVLSENLLPYANAAWQQAVAQRVHNVRFDLREANENRLARHGLLGIELEFKLRALEAIWDRYLTQGGGQLLKKVLDIIDDVLQSILEAIGASGALDEFKSVLTNSIETE